MQVQSGPHGNCRIILIILLVWTSQMHRNLYNIMQQNNKSLRCTAETFAKVIFLIITGASAHILIVILISRISAQLIQSMPMKTSLCV